MTPDPAETRPGAEPESAPTDRPKHEPAKPQPPGAHEGEGTNATQPEPDPAADLRRQPLTDGRAPRGPYPTGND